MKEIWEEVLSLVREKVSPNVFRIWIRPIRLIEIKEIELTLGCPNRFFMDWVKLNYLPLVQVALENIMHRQYKINLKVDTAKRRFLDVSERDEQLPLPNIPVSPYIGRRFLKSFTFNEFVVGASNNLAYSAAWALATGSNNYGNCVYFFSNTGLGKSHLSQAIGNYVLSENPGIRISYLTAEEFANDMVSSLKKNQIESFKERYRRNCDMLMLEEVHFLSGKDKIQAELTYTLDALLSDSKKVVFTSCQLPEGILGLRGRLKSRLASGLITHIDSPDYDTRVMIIKKKATKHGVVIPDEITHCLAECVEGDIRQLESCVIGCIARSSLLNQPIDLTMAKEILRGFSGKKKTALTIEAIQNLVGNYYKISMEEMRSKSRKKAIVLCRDIAMYLCRNHTQQSLEFIGKEFNRDHSTVLHGISVIEQEIRKKGKVYYQIELLSDRLEKSENQP